MERGGWGEGVGGRCMTSRCFCPCHTPIRDFSLIELWHALALRSATIPADDPLFQLYMLQLGVFTTIAKCCEHDHMTWVHPAGQLAVMQQCVWLGVKKIRTIRHISGVQA